MTVVVLDASAALAWLLPAQATLSSTRFIAQADGFDFIAPFIFSWEVENLLLQFLSSRKMPKTVYDVTVKQLRDYDIAEFSIKVSEVVDLARSVGISLFDAAYLDLALKRRAPIVSRDKALVEAARDRGVSVYDLRGEVT